jgi:hypothetical protein
VANILSYLKECSFRGHPSPGVAEVGSSLASTHSCPRAGRLRGHSLLVVERKGSREDSPMCSSREDMRRGRQMLDWQSGLGME